jgi:translocation and assembly module TamB
MAIKGHVPGATEGPAEPGSSRSPARSRTRTRALRWFAGVFVALVALIGFGVLGLWFIGKDLDRPWIKARLLALGREQGLFVDYDGLTLSLLDGLRARSFRLLTPPALAQASEDFVRIESFELRAPLWKMALGGRTIDRLQIGSVLVTIVSDASGRTTLSELFPERPAGEREPREPSPLSRSLGDLPRLSLDALEISKIEARSIELGADGSRRVLTLSGLGARGKLQSGGEGLSGTALEVVGAPLAVELSDGSTMQHARLGVDVNLSAPDPRALALALHVDLERQDVIPNWSWRGELLELESSLRFDEAAGKTTITLAPLAALRKDLSINASTDLFDGDSTRMVTNGTVHVDLAGLPFAVEGLALDDLKLDLTSKELSWDGARVAGSIDYTGSLRGATIDHAAGSVRVADVTLGGRGGFQPEGGQFEARLMAASLASSSPELAANLAALTLELGGTTRELAGAQQIEARANAALASAELATASGQAVDIRSVTLRTWANGSALGLAARTIPRLDGELAVASLSLADAAGRTHAQHLDLKAGVDQLTVEATSELGVQGDASVSLSLPTLDHFEGTGRGASRRAAFRVGGLDVHAALPLSLARAKATIALASLRAGESVLERLGLDVEAEAPLGWGPDRDAGASATANGRIARVDAGGGSRGVLSALRLAVNKLGRDSYRLELDATGSSLALGGLPLPGDVRATVRADAQPLASTVKLSSALRGERGAQVELGLDASFDRASERLTYTAELSAEKLEAFAGVAAGLDARASRVALDGARLAALARGELAGVLHAAPGELPAPTRHPLGTASGTQSVQLELAGLDYRGPEGVLRVPELALDLESTHRAERGGNANARITMRALEVDSGGTALKLGGLDQTLVATFDRAPDRGLVDVRTSLSLDSAAQSWLPGYPVKDLTLSSNVQIDRMSSIYLRELVLDNPASGSSLRAAGTLELLAQGSPTDGKTIVGRQALSFEGRLEQKLLPLVHLEVASHASGTVGLPFRLESGGLLGYRLLATLEAKQVSFVRKDGTLAVEGLNGSIPMVEEFALLPSGPVIGAGPRTSPLQDTRFFDVHPFLSQDDYVTARSISLGGLAPLGPVAANMRIERSDFIIDQLQTGYRGGQIVGQVRVAWRDGDPIVRLRLNATGVRSGKSNDVFDANTALTFVPKAMILDGKVQIVRASREHLEDILDVLDPYHESANANRVRQGLALGYPKFVRFQLHDGAVDTKVELGGLAQLVRIDEIKAVPLGPILQKYAAPSLSGYLRPAEPNPPASADPAVESALRAGGAAQRQP